MKVPMSVKASMTLCLGMSLCGVAGAQELVIYPAKGQSSEQQTTDKNECYGWARDNSGFDPATAQVPTPQQAEQRRGGALRGAAGGALIGAAVGNDGGDDAAKGAAAGAVVGRMRQNSRNRDAAQSGNSQYQSELDAYNQQRQGYERSYQACLEGRGYTVK